MIRASPWSVPASRRSDAKGEAKRNPLRGERTDTEHGDGPSSNRANGGQFDRAKGTDQVAVVRVQQRQEEIRDDGKTALHPQTAGVRGLRGPESQRGLRRRGQAEDRGLRSETVGYIHSVRFQFERISVPSRFSTSFIDHRGTRIDPDQTGLRRDT
jgi:hypothetical protein